MRWVKHLSPPVRERVRAFWTLLAMAWVIAIIFAFSGDWPLFVVGLLVLAAAFVAWTEQQPAQPEPQSRPEHRPPPATPGGENVARRPPARATVRIERTQMPSTDMPDNPHQKED